jgi:septin family protein
MSRLVLVMGEAGSGKSTSIRTLDPKETFIFNSLGKDLPFRGSAKQYTYWDKEKNPAGNVLQTTNGTVVIQWLNFISQKMPHIKNIIIDDNTHQSSMEYIHRMKEEGWNKFNDIAYNMVTIVETASKLRDDLVVFVLHHVTVEGDGIVSDKKYKAQTIGKVVDQKMSSYESFFPIVFLAEKAKTKEGDVEYFFLTRDAGSTAKTPMGMFEDMRIPNDLGAIRSRIVQYYTEEA